MQKILRFAIPTLLIIILISSLFGKTLFPLKEKMIYGGDIYDAYFFWKNYLKENIRSGTIPFWNPYNFSGTPFLAHPNINIFYPPNWLFILLPLNQSFAFYFFLHMAISGMTMYWLARQFTDKWGSFFAAAIFSLGGFFAARVYSGHPEYVDSASFLPLAFGLARQALNCPSRKKIILAALGWGTLLLSGNDLFFLFACELTGLYVLYRFVAGFTLRLLFKDVKVILLSLILAFGLTAFALLPKWQFLSLSLRSAGVPYSTAGIGSLPISGLLLFLQPFFFGRPFSENYSYYGPWPNLSEYTYYLGVLPLILVLTFSLSLILKIIFRFLHLGGVHSATPEVFLRLSGEKQGKGVVNREIWFFLGMVIPIFLLVSLGTNISPNIHRLLWQILPFYKSLRFPARHLFVVFFSLSLTSGMVLGGFKNRLIKILFIILAVGQLWFFDKQFFRLTNLPFATFDQKLINLLREDKSLFRLLPDFPVVSSVRRDFDFGAATFYKIQTTSDYNSMILWRYYHFIELLDKTPYSLIPYYNVEIPPPDLWSPATDYLNVKYLLSDRKYDAVEERTGEKYRLVLEGERYRLYENLKALPRFFLVGKMEVFPLEKTLEEKLSRDPYGIGETIYLLENDLKEEKEFALDCREKERGKVEVISYTPNQIKLEAVTFCNSFLSTSEVFYPGWKAKINGKTTEVYRSNLAFRAVFLPKGVHTLELYYRPDIYYLGAAVSLLSLVILYITYK